MSCTALLNTLHQPLFISSPQSQYALLPPSLARFSPSDPDTIVYTGYGLEQNVQFYSISKKSVLRTSALTHWAISMAVSPHGHLLAFGCQGMHVVVFVMSCVVVPHDELDITGLLKLGH